VVSLTKAGYPAAKLLRNHRSAEDVATTTRTGGGARRRRQSWPIASIGAHAQSTGKLGATGFCWGGGGVNFLATATGAELAAGAPSYDAVAETAAVANIKAALLIHYAEKDERINAIWPGYEAALIGCRHADPGMRCPDCVPQGRNGRQGRPARIDRGYATAPISTPPRE